MRSVLSFYEFGQILEKRDHVETLLSLLSVADNPGSPGEGEAALYQAKRLAAKIGMDLDQARLMLKNRAPKPLSKPDVDPSDLLFAEISIIAKHIPGIHFNGRTTNTPFAKDAAVWSIHHEGTTVEIHVPMNGLKDHHVMWYLVVRNRKSHRISDTDILTKSTNAQDLLNALRTVDWKGLAMKADEEEKAAKAHAYNNAQQLTPEAEAVVNLAKKHGYELEPAHVGLSWREMKNEPFKLTIMPDGSWYHETRQGDVHTNKWKADTRRFDKKNNGPQKLDIWLKTKRKAGEAAFSIHDEINAIAKLLGHFGFKPEEKSGNQNNWINPVAGLRVQFGPNKFRGALKKDDSIFWMIRSYMRNPANPQNDLEKTIGKDNMTGHDAEKLKHVLEKVAKRAEIGFDKVVAVLHKYGFFPDPKTVERPTHNMEYFNTKGKYYAAVSPKTGEWMLYIRFDSGLSDMLSKHGTTADELEMILSRKKPNS